MKKIIAVLVTLTIMIGLLTSCGGDGAGVSVDLKNIGTSQVLVGNINNNSDEDVSATVTVTWFDVNGEQIGYSVSEVPYVMAGDTVFDVFDFGEAYDNYDVMVETGEVSEEAQNFYGNLTVEGEMKEDGTVSYTVGGGNGENFEADVVILYIDENDKVVGYDIQTVNGAGTVSGTFDGCDAKGCSGYMMNVILK